jgi:ADP-ribosyl-[dinitrogen reductase] hydrolase
VAAAAATAAAFLDGCAAEYDGVLAAKLAAFAGEGQEASSGASAVREVRRLLASGEPEGSKERCWNWRAPSLEIHAAIASRGHEYHGYPVLPGYFGAFCMDGLAMALWAVRGSSSFDGAIERCVNLLGDADSTGAVAGQLAGAFYGLGAVHPAWRRDVKVWDDDDAPVRAALLFALGGC